MYAEMLRFLDRKFSSQSLLIKSGQMEMGRRQDLVEARLHDIEVGQAAQRVLLEKILAAVTLPPAVSAILTVEAENLFLEGEHIEMKIAQNLVVMASVALLNATGGPGRIDGVPTWLAAPEGVVTLEPAADGLSCKITTLPVPADQPAASVVITFDADGDLGEGVHDIVATAALTVYDPASAATIADVTFGVPTPVEVPPAA